METDKRTATDILLDLEARMGVVEKRLQNSENLLKILLSRLNAALSGGTSPSTQTPASPVTQPVSPAVVNKDNFEDRPKTSEFAKMAAQQGLDVEDDDPEEETGFIDEVFTARAAQPPDEHELIESPTRGNARGQRGPKSEGSKQSISQVIKREDTPLYIANVEVFDENGLLINQTRTNTKGRWLMALAPGNYKVHVLKRFPPDSGKLPIDTSYPITVPPSKKPMELDPLNLSEPERTTG
jgi:hypothetical protein